MKFKRIFIIVTDSLGIGEMPDADKFGDKGANTFVHISEKCGGLNIPTLNSLGISLLNLSLSWTYLLIDSSLFVSSIEMDEYGKSDKAKIKESLMNLISVCKKAK